MSNIIELRNVIKTYGNGDKKVTALKGINFKLPKGESLVIVGPSGSGKSTMLQLIGGLDRATEGEVIIDGHNISRLNDKKLSLFRNRHVGFIFQFFNLIEYFTVLQNIAWPLIIRGINEKDALEHAMSLLEKVNLIHRAGHFPKELSGGEMQRVAIARSLANNPQLILADEPTGNLDKKNAENILSLFKDISKSGVSIVIVTHDPRVSDNFEHVIHFEHGEITTLKKEDK